MSRFRLIGAAHLDRTGQTDRAAQIGQSNPGRFREAPGGAALNVASLLSALGDDVTLETVLGDDAGGAAIRDALADRDVLLAAQTDAEHPTASFTAILDANGRLVIALADMAIYDTFTLTAASAPVDWLVVDANIPAQMIGAALANPATKKAALTVSAAKAPRLRNHLGTLDMLFTNRAEAAALCELPNDLPVTGLASALRSRGVPRALITDGSAPLCVLDGSSVETIAPPETKVVDVIGAGDAMAAGCLHALAKGDDLADAVRFGIRTAAAILAVNGPWRDDLSSVLKGCP